MITFLKSLFTKKESKLKISKQAKELYEKNDFHRVDIHLWKGVEFQGTVSEILTTKKGEYINSTLIQNNLLATKYQSCSHLFVGNSQKLSLREFFDYATTYPDVEKELIARQSKANFFKTIVYVTIKDKQYAKEWHTVTDKAFINRQEEKLRILEHYAKKGIVINQIDFGYSEFVGVAEKNHYLAGDPQNAQRIKELLTPLHLRSNNKRSKNIGKRK